MKTNHFNSVVSTLLIVCTLSFWACEDTLAEFHPEDVPGQVDDNPTINVSPKTETTSFANNRHGGSKPFFYTIEKISCTYQGFTLKVNIYKPLDYEYSWIIDELPAGNSNQLHCVSGEKVYLTVKRYSDLATVSQYFELPPSGIHNGVAHYESSN